MSSRSWALATKDLARELGAKLWLLLSICHLDVVEYLQYTPVFLYYYVGWEHFKTGIGKTSSSRGLFSKKMLQLLEG